MMVLSRTQALGRMKQGSQEFKASLVHNCKALSPEPKQDKKLEVLLFLIEIFIYYFYFFNTLIHICNAV